MNCKTSTPNQIKNTFNLRYKPDVFKTKKGVLRFLKRSIKPKEVVIGDNYIYWVVYYHDAQILKQNGYEVLRMSTPH